MVAIFMKLRINKKIYYLCKYISNKINKCNKMIGKMKKLSLFLSRKTLLTIYKSFVKPDSDYTDIIYDKTFNEPFKTKIEMIQYRAAFFLLWRLKVHHMIVFFKELA